MGAASDAAASTALGALDETIIPTTVLGLTPGVVGFQHRTPLSLHHARLSLRQAALLVGMMS